MSPSGKLCCILFLPFFSAVLSAQAVEEQSPAELYAGIKVAVKQIVSSPAGQNEYRSLLGEPNHYDFNLCFDSSMWGVPAESPLGLATTIALHLEFYQMLLRRLEVPSAVTQKTFDVMEAMALASLQDRSSSGEPMAKHQRQGAAAFKDAQKRLAKELNDYGATKRPVMEFVYVGECGAFEAEVKITTTPPGGTVRFIPLFGYALCQATKINPEDTDKCQGWQTAVKVTEDLVGKYHYIAKWPDGKQSKGVFDVREKTAINLTPQ